ncbi:MAG: hypothetical protein ACPG5B_03780 [Chitinophagales bacterium]
MKKKLQNKEKILSNTEKIVENTTIAICFLIQIGIFIKIVFL